MSMSWRRFRIYVEALYDLRSTTTTVTRDEDDWRAAVDKAIGRTPGQNIKRMSLDEFMVKGGNL